MSKDVDLLYLDEICEVYCYYMKENFHGIPNQREHYSGAPARKARQRSTMGKKIW